MKQDEMHEQVMLFYTKNQEVLEEVHISPEMWGRWVVRHPKYNDLRKVHAFLFRPRKSKFDPRPFDYWIQYATSAWESLNGDANSTRKMKWNALKVMGSNHPALQRLKLTLGAVRISWAARPVGKRKGE